MQQIWHSIFCGILMSLTNFQQYKFLHFIPFAPVYYYIVAFDLLFFLRNVIKNELFRIFLTSAWLFYSVYLLHILIGWMLYGMLFAVLCLFLYAPQSSFPTIAFPFIVFCLFFRLCNCVPSLLGVRLLFYWFLSVTCASFICTFHFR
jgi:hypothetical protein